MIFAREFILFACVLGIEGARTQSKAIETALEKFTQEGEFGIKGAKTQTEAIETALKKSTKEQEFGIEGAKTQTEAIETALEKSTKEQEAMSEMIAVGPKGCKRSCDAVPMGNPRILDLDDANITAKLLDMCTLPDCNLCPRCQPAAEIAVDVEQNRTGETSHTDRELGDVEEVAGVVPFCAKKPATKMETECKLKSTAGEWLKCAHYKTGWCNREKAGANPGDSYRFERYPLCCKTDSEMNEKAMTNVEQRKTEIVSEIVTQANNPSDTNREIEPLPVCTSDTTFRVENQADGTAVCRDSKTNELAENVCCDQDIFNLLSAKAAADALCSEVLPKYCKSDTRAFENKRHKFKGLDARFTCRRMYMCCHGDNCVGLVNNQALCSVLKDLEKSVKLRKAMEEKGMELRNLEARKECVAVAIK